MDSGFVIFRDPKSASLQMWKGHFESKSKLSFSTGSRFFVKPWQGSLLEMTVEEIASEAEVAKIWLNEAILSDYTNDSNQSKASFEQFVQFAVTGIAQGDFNKIVASRNQFLNLPSPNVWQAFENACRLYPQAFVSILYDHSFGLWLGATPETFGTYINGVGETVALAGTLANGTETWTDKERLEQTETSRFIQEILQKRSIDAVQSSSLEEITQGNLRHLRERFTFTVSDTDFVDFTADLHPTPAVGGYPVQQALSFIDRFEKTKRGLFAGWVGWAKDDHFESWVNLRCCQIHSNGIDLFAGCGLNAQSNPEKEWLETEAKMQIIASCF